MATKRVGAGRGAVRRGAAQGWKNKAGEQGELTNSSAALDETDVKPVRNAGNYIDKEFRKALPRILQALEKEAKLGSATHARLYLQFRKENPAEPKGNARRREKTLSGMLMDELKRRQDEREAAADAAQREHGTTGEAEGAAIGHAEAGG